MHLTSCRWAGATCNVLKSNRFSIFKKKEREKKRVQNKRGEKESLAQSFAYVKKNRFQLFEAMFLEIDSHSLIKIIDEMKIDSIEWWTNACHIMRIHPPLTAERAGKLKIESDNCCENSFALRRKKKFDYAAAQLCPEKTRITSTSAPLIFALCGDDFGEKEEIRAKRSVFAMR